MFVLSCRRSPPRRIRRIWGLGGPGSLQTLAEPAQEVDQGTQKGRAALEAPRRTDARQLPHEQPEVEATDVHEQAFEDIGMAAQMHPAHAPGLVEMRVGPFHPFAALPQQVLSTMPSNPPPVCLGAQLAISVNNCPPPRDPRSRMTSFKRTQRKYVQKAYRVRNWREYETGLRARGSLTVWLGLTDGKLANWNSPRPTRRKPGRQRKYSNHAIETTVTLGLVFGLASRQTRASCARC